jgi:Putative adhesin
MTEVVTEVSSLPQTLSLGPCKMLSLRATFADIQIVPIAEGQEPCITAGHGHQLDQQSVQVSIHGEQASVTISNSLSSWWRSLFTSRTGRDLVLYVPKDVDAEIHTSAGRVRVSQLSGCRLMIANEAGSTRLEDVQGKMILSSEAGEIRGDDLAGSFDISASAGEVRLSILGVDPGEHKIRASMGTIKLFLAKDLAVSFDTHAPMGSVKVVYPSFVNAPARLALSADMGEIKVREYSRAGSRFSETRNEHRTIYRRSHEEQEPYRSPAVVSTIEPETLDRILAKVADGSLPTQTAADLIRALRA